MNDLEKLEAKIKHAVELYRKFGHDESRLEAFAKYAREGKWLRAQRILWKSPICGARKPDGRTCLASPFRHGRCVWHGGGNPNPAWRSEAGRRRIAEAQRKRWARWRAQRDQVSPF